MLISAMIAAVIILDKVVPPLYIHSQFLTEFLLIC